MNWTLLKNSLLVSALTTLLAVASGFFVALFLAGLGWRWRRWWIGGAVIGLALPPFLVTGCWLHLLGLTGVWRTWLPLDIYSLGGTVWVLSLMLWPISLLLILGAWQRLEPGQLESEPKLTGWPLIRLLLVPLARSALAQSAVLTFVLALNNFAVPALLQVKVFPVEVWVEFNNNLKIGSALTMSWPLVLAPLLLLFWLRRREISWPRLEAAVAAGVFRRQLGAGWFWAGGVFAVGATFLSVGLPLTDLCASGRTWQEFFPAFKAGQGAAINSAIFSMVSAALVVGVALATWRWPLGVIVWLPFLVPGVLVGIVLILLFNSRVLFLFYESVGIVFLAWTLRYLAVGWNTTAHALRSVDRDLSDSARLEGASRWQLLRHVHWPQVAPQLGAAWYLTYLFCLWDAETLILIMPPGAETLSVRVFNFLHYGHNPQVNALCLILLLIAVAPLALFLAAKKYYTNRTRNDGVGLGERARLARTGRRPAGQPGRQLSAPYSLVARAAQALGGTPRAATETVALLFLIASYRLVWCLRNNYTFVALKLAWGEARGRECIRSDTRPTEQRSPRPISAQPEGRHVFWAEALLLAPHRSTSGYALVPVRKHLAPSLRPKSIARMYSYFGDTTPGGTQISPSPAGRSDKLTPNPSHGGERVPFWTARVLEGVRAGSGRMIPLLSGAFALIGLLAGCSPATPSNEAPVESKFFSRVKVIGARGAGPGEFNKPRSVAVDAQDNLYAVDMTGRVQKFSPDGTFLSFWQMPQTDKGKPKGMCRDEKGNVVVLEPHYSRVNHFTPEGRLVAQWGAHGTNAGNLAFPRSVIVNSRGDIFVSEYGLAERVQQFTSEGGNWVRVLGRGGDGDGEFNRAEGLGVDAQDRLYVADSCHHRIQIFSADGKFLAAFGRPGSGRGEMSYPYDVKVDGQGFQFVCEFGNSRIQIFDAHGQPVEILGGPGAAPGQFSNPWGVALDSKGNLYVADAMNHRVQKFIRRDPMRAQSEPAVSGQLLVVSRQSSVVRRQLSVISCQLSVVSEYPKTNCRPGVADHGPRTTDHGPAK